MIRNVSFTPEGSIRIEGKFGTDIVSRGVVYLTREQADEALAYGWTLWGWATSETDPPLYPMRRV